MFDVVKSGFGGFYGVFIRALQGSVVSSGFIWSSGLYVVSLYGGP